MKKNMTALSLLWISLTSMIGSGWLFGSIYSAHLAGPAALLAWPIAGLLLLVVAFSYAELATMFPKSDSLAQMPLYTHGHLTAIIMSILTWLSLAVLPAIETQGLIQYASNYIPGLIDNSGGHYSNTLIGYVFALVLLLSFVCINYFGLHFFARINAGFTIWKIVVPTVTIGSLLVMNNHTENLTQYGGFMPYGWQGVMSAMSSGGILFSLLGFRQVVIMMGEVKNPGKYVPLILISSILLTTLLYTCLQWVFITSLSPENLGNGWNNLTFAGDAGPFAALATLAGLVWLSMLLYADAFVSPYSTGLVYTTTAAQMLATIDSIADLPKKISQTNTHQVPWVSLWINFILALLMSFVLRGWQEMSSFLVAVLMLSYGVGPLCLVCLRNQLPDYNRPFKLRFSKCISFTGFYTCTAGVYWSGLISVRLLELLTILILIAYLAYHRYTKSKQQLDVKQSLWLFLYLAGIGNFSLLGNYGGKHIIPPYWDLLYLLVFTLIIYILAYASRNKKEYTEHLISPKQKP